MPSIDPQLLQIALDKGLLALIVAGMAFFLSKRLERFKAKNTYFQRLSEKRLEAYQNLILLLSAHLDYIQNLTIDIELRRGLHPKASPTTWKQPTSSFRIISIGPRVNCQK